MKKLGTIVKENSENRIKDALKESEALFIVKYSGVSSPDLCSLRLSLHGANAELFVVKNSTARKALKGPNAETLIKSIEGPCGLIFIKEEPVSASKVIFNFLKEHEQLKLEGGTLKDKILEAKDIEAMSKLASKEVLRAQLVGALNAPISGLVISLNQILSKFVICLDQIKQQKEKTK